MPDSTENVKRFHARVQGRVQGVGFRYFVAQEADGAVVTGWVRNRRDRSVEVVAEGEPAGLARLAAALRRGPRGASVTSVDLQWEEPTGEYTAFKIRWTR